MQSRGTRQRPRLALVDLDEKDRTRRSLERRLSASRLGQFKPMDHFDWAWPTKIDRDLVDRALDGAYLRIPDAPGQPFRRDSGSRSGAWAAIPAGPGQPFR